MKMIFSFLMLSALCASQANGQQSCPEYVQIQNNNAYNREQLKLVLASKADLANAVADLKAAIAAQPGPQPSASAAPAHSGVFIGATEFDSLASAGAAYKSGDTIHITKSLDNDSTALVNGDVTVICDPGVKLTWSAGYNKRIAWGKGFFDLEGATQNATIKGCTMDGAVLDINSGGNAACIRIVDGVNSAVIDGVQCTNSDNGILGSAKTTTVTNSKFWNNGVTRKGYTHNVYFSAWSDQVTVKNSYFGPVDQGNVFKSRAKATLIDGCQFETNTTRNSSYLIDIPNAGQTVVKNSVLLKGPGQSQRFILSYGVEGVPADGRVNTYEFTNNIVVSDMMGAFINGDTNGTMNFHDNVMAGQMDYTIPQTNTKMFADRASAGLPAAPALPALPATK